MREFLHSWRRKVGVVALLIACIFLMLWVQAIAAVRSRTASESLPVVKIIGLWEQAKGFDAQGNPCEGAAGRILLLNKNFISVRGSGKVTISLFDGTDIDAKAVIPFQTVTYDATAWSRCASFGSLGSQYQIFIPIQGDLANVGRCEVWWTSDDGTVVRSDAEMWKHPALPRIKSQANTTDWSSSSIPPSIGWGIVEIQSYVCVLIILLTALSAYLILIPSRKQCTSHLHE
jgi:hypothetical protein